MQGRPPAAAGAGRAGQRANPRRHRRAVRGRSGGRRAATRARRPRPGDHRDVNAGNHRAPAVHAGGGAGLPDPGPPQRDAVRRRGATPAAGGATGLQPARRVLRAGRADHRPASARQRPPAGDLAAPEGAGQQHRGGRARRGHHAQRRPRHRPRPRRRHAGRPRGCRRAAAASGASTPRR